MQDHRTIFFSLEADAMKGYMYVYAYKGSMYLRARAEGFPECQSTPLGYDIFESLNTVQGGKVRSVLFVPYAEITEWPPPSYELSKDDSRARPLRLVEVSSELEDTEAAIAGATAGLSTIRVSLDGVPTLSVTGCMLDSTLYRKMQVMAATNVQYGNGQSSCYIDDLWVRNKVPISQL
jgi:hypothetical protein